MTADPSGRTGDARGGSPVAGSAEALDPATVASAALFGGLFLSLSAGGMV